MQVFYPLITESGRTRSQHRSGKLLATKWVPMAMPALSGAPQCCDIILRLERPMVQKSVVSTLTIGSEMTNVGRSRVHGYAEARTHPCLALIPKRRLIFHIKLILSLIIGLALAVGYQLAEVQQDWQSLGQSAGSTEGQVHSSSTKAYDQTYLELTPSWSGDTGQCSGVSGFRHQLFGAIVTTRLLGSEGKYSVIESAESGKG
ncbi:hypothetical protein B0H13DRAFT_1878008 [Mycena leptocephala]|nr:hypothetical protein B0H13DRAFT_1878008 [Mycena leptocephala]